MNKIWYLFMSLPGLLSRKKAIKSIGVLKLNLTPMPTFDKLQAFKSRRRKLISEGNPRRLLNIYRRIKPMQVTINVPDNLPPERLRQKLKEIEANLKVEAKSIETTKSKEKKEVDPWLEFLENIDQYAVETGIEDFAENHDHYLYGTPKHS